MALPSTAYKATLQLSDIDHGVYETIQTTVAQHPYDAEERFVARLLALNMSLFFPTHVGQRKTVIQQAKEPSVPCANPLVAHLDIRKVLTTPLGNGNDAQKLF